MKNTKIIDLEGYKAFLAITKNQAPRTIKDRVALMKRILENVPSLSFEQVREFFYQLKMRGGTASYLNMLINSIKNYCDFLKEKGESFDARILEIKWMRPADPIRAIMTDEEIELFLTYPFHTFNWKVYWNLLAFTGARPNEIATLVGGDISFTTKSIVFKKTKTGVPRIIPTPPNLYEMVEELVSKCGDNRLFPTANDKTWGYHFRNIIKKLGMEKRIGLNTYSFRHSYITALIRSDVSLFKIKKLVGHQNITTTERYTHLTGADVESAVYAHPLIRKYVAPKVIIRDIKSKIEAYKLGDNPKLTYAIEETDEGLSIQLKIRKEYLTENVEIKSPIKEKLRLRNAQLLLEKIRSTG